MSEFIRNMRNERGTSYNNDLHWYYLILMNSVRHTCCHPWVVEKLGMSRKMFVVVASSEFIKSMRNERGTSYNNDLHWYYLILMTSARHRLTHVWPPMGDRKTGYHRESSLQWIMMFFPWPGSFRPANIYFNTWTFILNWLELKRIASSWWKSSFWHEIYHIVFIPTPASGSLECTGITCRDIPILQVIWMKKYSWYIIVSSALGVIEIRWVSAESKWHTCCQPWVVEKLGMRRKIFVGVTSSEFIESMRNERGTSYNNDLHWYYLNLMTSDRHLLTHVWPPMGDRKTGYHRESYPHQKINQSL